MWKIQHRRGMLPVRPRRAGGLLHQYRLRTAARPLHADLSLGPRDDAIAARRCEGGTAEGSQWLFQGRIAHAPGEEQLSRGPGICTEASVVLVGNSWGNPEASDHTRADARC